MIIRIWVLIASTRLSIDPSSAREGQDLRDPLLVTMHPFHPLCGQELEFDKRRRNWRQDRVYFCATMPGEFVSLPADWTDVVAVDPFVVVAAGRSPFHIAGLLELSDLIARVSALRPAATAEAVKQTTPWMSGGCRRDQRAWTIAHVSR